MLNSPILLTPGPVSVPPFVTEAISKPPMQHRSAKFESFYSELLNQLKYLFQTDQQVFGMIGNGSMAMQAAIYSLFRKKEKVIVANMGKFSGRWVNDARFLGLEVEEIEVEWGKTIALKQIMQRLQEEKHVKGVILTHCETSTATLLDVEEIAFAIKQFSPEILILVDAISTIGALPFYFDAWKLDFAVVSSQKALMNPTGTCFFAISDLAVERLKPSAEGDNFNLWNYYSFAQKGSYPYSPPVQLFYGIKAAMDYVEAKTLPVIWNETIAAARFFRKELITIGGEIWSEFPSDSLTAFSFPNVNMRNLKNSCIEQGVEMSGGQDYWKGKIMRIAHFGLYDTSVTAQAVEVLREFIPKLPQLD